MSAPCNIRPFEFHDRTKCAGCAPWAVKAYVELTPCALHGWDAHDLCLFCHPSHRRPLAHSAAMPCTSASLERHGLLGANP